MGDGGTTEPNDATRRYGAEATLFWHPTAWLTLDGSAAITHAWFHGVPPGLTRIPNSVGNVARTATSSLKRRAARRERMCSALSVIAGRQVFETTCGIVGDTGDGVA